MPGNAVLFGVGFLDRGSLKAGLKGTFQKCRLRPVESGLLGLPSSISFLNQTYYEFKMPNAGHEVNRAVNWKLMEDQNKENWNAGNGGDLVKHTVYLAALRYLLPREPWSHGLTLRECHAGRGIYRIAEGDVRRRLLFLPLLRPRRQ